MFHKLCYFTSLLLFIKNNVSVTGFLSQATQSKIDSTSLFAHHSKNNHESMSKSTSSRRELILESIIPASLATILVTNPSPVFASGGATAGGAYLLSAKQRYNERVIAGVKEFKALSTSLDNADFAPTRGFFTSLEQGSWDDFSSAGYLLSNAFRRNSTTPPDSLPSVQKWKAFAKQVDGMKKACLEKKSKSGTTKAYAESMALLDAYLEAVELPPALEL